MEQKQFTRTIEDFSCEHCGALVKGNGYTNHCPKCLWSKHVDINPGDRREPCKGLMEPISGEKQGHEYVIRHRCVRCGFERRNHLDSADSFDAFVKLPAAQPKAFIPPKLVKKFLE